MWVPSVKPIITYNSPFRRPADCIIFITWSSNDQVLLVVEEKLFHWFTSNPESWGEDFLSCGVRKKVWWTGYPHHDAVLGRPSQLQDSLCLVVVQLGNSSWSAWILLWRGWEGAGVRHSTRMWGMLCSTDTGSLSLAVLSGNPKQCTCRLMALRNLSFQSFPGLLRSSLHWFSTDTCSCNPIFLCVLSRAVVQGY